MKLMAHNFDYIKHWTPEQKVECVKRTWKYIKKYSNWLGFSDATDGASVGVFIGYKKLGDNFLPFHATGYIRTELRSQSRNKQRYVNVTEVDIDKRLKPTKRVANKILPMMDGSFKPSLQAVINPDTIGLLADCKKILNEHEFDIVQRHIIYDEELIRSEKDIYKNALLKMKEVLCDK